MKRITEYTNIETIAESDVLPIVDVSDTSQASTGSTKKGSIEKIADYVKNRTETLTNKTLTSPKINEDVVLTATSTELNKITGMLDWFYPVGTIYETTSTDLDTTTKMAAHFGGTWESYGDGRVLVGKSADTEFDTIDETGGAKAHTLTIPEMPKHSHKVRYTGTGANGVHGGLPGTNVDATPDYNYLIIAEEGGGQAHNNLQPYIVVYRYRRTS